MRFLFKSERPNLKEEIELFISATMRNVAIDCQSQPFPLRLENAVSFRCVPSNFLGIFYLCSFHRPLAPFVIHCASGAHSVAVPQRGTSLRASFESEEGNGWPGRRRVPCPVFRVRRQAQRSQTASDATVPSGSRASQSDN